MVTLLRYDDEHHRIGRINMLDKATRKNATGMAHVAFTYSSLMELCTAWMQRKANGIGSCWSVNHGPTTSVYYRDPDGDVVETQCDSMRGDEADEFMRGKEDRVNPIGVDFDIENLIRRFKARESEEILMKRVEIGPRRVEDVPL